MTRISKTGKGYEGAFRVASKTIYNGMAYILLIAGR